MDRSDARSRGVFISYVRENANVIFRLREGLQARGIRCWLDRDNIDPGKPWKDAIRAAIESGSTFLACFSQEYAQKSSTYMNEELIIAVNVLRSMKPGGAWLIPLKLSECEIPGHEIGPGRNLQDLQFLTLDDGWDLTLDRLADIIMRETRPAASSDADEFSELMYTYLGLKALIEHGEGQGFHNADLGHPVYRLGALDVPLDEVEGWGDSPQNNLLFRMISRASRDLKARKVEELNETWWDDLSEWGDFCRFAVAVYERESSRRRGMTRP